MGRRGSRLAVATIGAAAWTGLLVGGGTLPHAAADSHEAPAPQVENASSTDVRFATMMVPHHEMGIVMTQMAIEKAVCRLLDQAPELSGATTAEVK